ncbi:hypothetical protein [Planktothrix phage Pra-JY27]|nr:hypothetical protein [Planktothrix phage Pag-Yong1]WEV89231.1 hypothetical protein [Synechococcus phage MinM2]
MIEHAEMVQAEPNDEVRARALCAEMVKLARQEDARIAVIATSMLCIQVACALRSPTLTTSESVLDAIISMVRANQETEISLIVTDPLTALMQNEEGQA